MFDPEVLYDETSDRFFMMATESTNGESFILLAVSDDSDPNGAWNRYRINTSVLAGATYDSPNMAVDDTVLYITGDAIGGPTLYPVFTFLKADLLAGVPLTPVQSTSLPTSTQSAGIPAVTEPGTGALYMIEHQEGVTSSQVRLLALTNPLTGITFQSFQLNVPTYRRPNDIVHLGSSGAIESFDARFWSVDYRNGSLWATHHVGAPSGGRTIVQWYEIAMNDWPMSGQVPTLVQTGTIDPGGNASAMFAAIGVNDDGDAAVTYALSSPTTFISMATSNRNGGDPSGVMGNQTIWRTSTAGWTSGRWGDYARVQADPVTGGLWANHEYAIGGTWRTWVQSLVPAPPANNACLQGDTVVAGETLFDSSFAQSTGPSEECGEFDADVWFRFAATEAGMLTVSTCGSDFDTQLALYGFACPSGDDSALVCSDDDCGTGSTLTFEVPGPGLYRIRVGSASGTGGTGVLTLSFDTGEALPCPTDCAPDNGDGTFGNGVVNIDDLLAVINAFGSAGDPCDAAPDNGDGTFGNGIVNIDDLLAVINAFGPCPE